MRIAVRQLLLGEQRAARLHQRDDRRIRLEHVLTLVFRQPFDEAAFVIDGRVDFEPVFLAGAEVFGAVAGRGVDNAASLLKRYVIAEHAGHEAVEIRMMKFAAIEGRSGNRAALRDKLESRRSGYRVRELLSDDVGVAFIVGREDVLNLPIKGERHAGRSGPGGCGPDDRIKTTTFRS